MKPKATETLKRALKIVEKENETRLQEPTLCNQCGEGMNFGFGNYAHGLVDANVCGGYESFFLFDCTEYTFNLCEKCLRDMFSKFKIHPSIREFGIGSDDWDFGKDQAAFEDRLRRKKLKSFE